MADFNFYLNRVGVRGPKGEQGEQGFSPIITVATNTLSEYILQIQTQNNTFLTANLREHKDDLGGTYIRYDRETGVMYAGEADTATTQNLGEVRFATSTELERSDGSTVVTPADVNTLIDARDYDGAIEAVDNKADANADNIATNTDNISTLQGQMTGILGNYVTTDTEQFISGRKKFTNIIAINSGVINSARNDDRTWLYNNNTRTVIGHNANTTSLVGSEIDIRTSGRNINITRQGNQYTNVDSGNISDYLPNMNNYYTTTQVDLMLNEKADISDIPTVPTNISAFTNDAGYITSSALPTVGNGTITFTQGGVTKGTITTNQSGNTTIALDAGGGTSYTAGNGIDITNDEISIDTNVVATQSDIPTNYVTTDTLQTIGGFKTFSNYVTVNGYVVAQSFKSSLNAEQFSLAYQGSDALSSGYIVFANKNSSVRKVILGNQNDFDNIQDNSVNGIIDKNGNAYLTSSNISTNAYIQALEGRITALEANINGGSAASA